MQSTPAPAGSPTTIPPPSSPVAEGVQDDTFVSPTMHALAELAGAGVTGAVDCIAGGDDVAEGVPDAVSDGADVTVTPDGGAAATAVADTTPAVRTAEVTTQTLLRGPQDKAGNRISHNIANIAISKNIARGCNISQISHQYRNPKIWGN